MISSMTGFGSANLKNEHVVLNVQVKSVNGRFLETRFRMPREYSALEVEIKKIIGQYLQRGTVDISLYRTYEAKSARIDVVPNVALAKSWKSACEELSKELQLPKEVFHELLGRVPDVMQIAEQSELPDWEKKAVLESIEAAVKACAEERKREGREQFKIFNQILDDLTGFVNSVKSRKKQIDAELKEHLGQRLKSLSETVAIDPQRLAQEAIFLAEKADIEEEITRAEAHIRAYKKALQESGTMGKKLEFYTQELHREVNTMGSKTQALAVTLDVIEAKTCVERLREQVQNVE
jgi:uncharacterized protein (TIGR00255 family)